MSLTLYYDSMDNKHGVYLHQLMALAFATTYVTHICSKHICYLYSLLPTYLLPLYNKLYS